LSVKNKASPPVTGTFDVSLNGTTISGIKADASESDIANLFQSRTGFLNVKRTKDCAGYNWNIKWVSGGNKPSISIASSSLQGNSVNIQISNIQDGGALFQPVLSNMLRTIHSKPQVIVAPKYDSL
jgi:hypothetical protein